MTINPGSWPSVSVRPKQDPKLIERAKQGKDPFLMVLAAQGLPFPACRANLRRKYLDIIAAREAAVLNRHPGKSAEDLAKALRGLNANQGVKP